MSRKSEFVIQPLDYARYRKFCRDLVLDALIEAPFEINAENVAKLKDSDLMNLTKRVVDLTMKSMKALGPKRWITSHKEVLRL